MKKYHLFLFLFALVTGLVSCSSDDSSGSEETARVSVRLTDAPGDYKHVYVEVEDVMIKTTAEGGEDEGWVSLEGVTPKRVDLLELTGGVTELLADTEIQAGYVHQIRLVLGDDNSIVTHAQPTAEYDLKTPSAQQSGLKVMVNEELEAGETYTFILDFDVDQSVVTTGTGSFSLKPVIRMAVEENTGAIGGNVHPTNDPVLVTAQSGSMYASAYTDSNGDFMIHGLPEGTYKVTATPVEGLGLDIATVNNVTVSQGATVILDDLFLDTE